jgi:hypothetical protein
VARSVAEAKSAPGHSAPGEGRENAAQDGDVRPYLVAAHANMRRIKRLLSEPSAEAADQAATLLREIEVQLGCVAAILRQHAAKPQAEIRASVEELQTEVAALAAFLAGADKMLSGWLDAIRTRRGGYTERGQAAPLTLVKKLSVEG